MATKKELIENINDAHALLQTVKEDQQLRDKLIQYIKDLVAELIPKLP